MAKAVRSKVDLDCVSSDMTGKQETIDEINDSLSSLSEGEVRRMFKHIKWPLLLDLQRAINQAIIDAEQRGYKQAHYLSTDT